MSGSRLTKGWLGWLATAGSVAIGGAALAAETVRLPAFGEVMDVRVVNLEVVVSRHGERLEGLGAKDFRLLVDGEETPIEFFSEIAGGRAVAAPSPGPRPALASGEAVGTRYLVFIDDHFAIPSTRDWALRELAGQLSLLGEGDSMAVVAFDGHRLDLLTGWTRSLARLGAVFEEAQQRRAYGLLRRSELRRAVPYGRIGSRPPVGSSFSGTGFHGLGRSLTGSLDPEQLSYDDVQDKISRVVRAAASALRGFAATPDRRPPGRKVMLLLSGGWPTYPRWGLEGLERMESDRRLFAPLVEAANLLGYTLYPVDLQVGHGSAATGAEYSFRAADRARAFTEQERERLAEDALYYLAEQTGGRALLAGARLTALERVIEDTRSYYWLGFTPSWQGDDEAHRVEIEMRPQGARARTRRSFSDLSRESQVSTWILAAHLFDAPVPGAGELVVELGTPRGAGVGQIVVSLSLEVPLDRVTLTPHEGGLAALLELRVAATDADGASADVPVVPVVLPAVGHPAPARVGRFETSLKLRRKPHRLLLSLYDPATGVMLVRRVAFEP